MTPHGRKILRWVIVAVVVVPMLLGAVAYRYIVTGGLVARQKPGLVETRVAGWVLGLSVPTSAKSLKNPLTSDASATVNGTAGRDLYHQKCEICHAYDGSGRSDTGGGLYPPQSTSEAMPLRR